MMQLEGMQILLAGGKVGLLDALAQHIRRHDVNYLRGGIFLYGPPPRRLVEVLRLWRLSGKIVDLGSGREGGR